MNFDYASFIWFSLGVGVGILWNEYRRWYENNKATHSTGLAHKGGKDGKN